MLHKDHYDIIILDSGVNTGHKALTNSAMIESFSFSCDKQLGQLELLSPHGDTKGHGTAITTIINKAEPQASIMMIEVFLEEKLFSVEEETLLSVLEYIYQNVSGNVINLSLGIVTTAYYQEFYDACKRLTEKGFIIVSAFDNGGAISYPAAFDCVIGVDKEKTCMRKNEFVIFDDTVINIGAMGSRQRVAWTNPDYMVVAGTSFACAHVTVQVYRFIKEGILKYENILKAFNKIAKGGYFYNKPHKSPTKYPFKIAKAAIFPFNKEMHSIIRFSDDLDFEIIDVYDTKYSMMVGSTTSHIMRDNTVLSKKIKNVTRMEWDAFDTLILGHLDELSGRIRQEDLSKEIIDEAIKHGKNIYAFDDISSYVDRQEYKNVFFPTVQQQDLSPFRAGKLAMVNKPILGVFGTSSQQGKFTLQLNLRKRLLEKGYRVGQIGTEPSALLYGMDYVYPMGHNSSVYTKEYDSIQYLNNCIWSLGREENEIILVGGQAGTVPPGFGNLMMYYLPQYIFLLGTLPDAVVLVVNPTDSDDTIRRSIHMMESSVDAHVVALVVFPMSDKDGWYAFEKKFSIDQNEFEQMKTHLEKQFNLPTFLLGNNQDIDCLTDTIIDYFADQ